MQQADSFTWDTNSDTNGMAGFAMAFTTAEGSRVWRGRVHANEKQKAMLASRWIGIMAALRQSGAAVTPQLARAAWYACIRTPIASERHVVRTARTIISRRIGPKTLTKIYSDAA